MCRKRLSSCGPVMPSAARITLKRGRLSWKPVESSGVAGRGLTTGRPAAPELTLRHCCTTVESAQAQFPLARPSLQVLLEDSATAVATPSALRHGRSDSTTLEGLPPCFR